MQNKAHIEEYYTFGFTNDLLNFQGIRFNDYFHMLSVNLPVVCLLSWYKQTWPSEILDTNLIFDGPISCQFQQRIFELKYLRWSLI